MDIEKGAGRQSSPKCRTVKRRWLSLDYLEITVTVQSLTVISFVIIFEDFIAQANQCNSKTTKA